LNEKAAGASASHGRPDDDFPTPATAIFPALTDELGPLNALDQQFCEVVSLTDLGRFTRPWVKKADLCITSSRDARKPPQGTNLEVKLMRFIVFSHFRWFSASAQTNLAVLTCPASRQTICRRRQQKLAPSIPGHGAE
jgi:hypothetical protein